MRRRFFTELNTNKYFSIEILGDGNIDFDFRITHNEYYNLLKYSKNSINNWKAIQVTTLPIKLNDIIYFKCTKWNVDRAALYVKTPCKIKGNPLSLCGYTPDNNTSFYSFLSKINVIEIDDSFWRNISMDYDLYSGLFDGNTYITSINIPDYITNIPRYFFSYCVNMTSVTIPDSVTSIGVGAFSGCTSLKEVYCKSVTPPTGDANMFYNNASGIKIYVPTASVDEYKSAEYWSDYAAAIVGYDF